MQKKEILKIEITVTQELDKIRDYFKSLNKNNIDSKKLAEKINNELPARIDYLDGVIRTTTISLLETDAMNTIEIWKDIDKNKFYNADIEKKISSPIKSNLFEKYNSNLIRNSFWGSVVFIVGLTSVVGFSFKLNFLLSLFISAILIIASKFITPNILNPHEKRKILQYLEKYLSEVSINYHTQISSISKEYYTIFNKIVQEAGEE